MTVQAAPLLASADGVPTPVPAAVLAGEDRVVNSLLQSLGVAVYMTDPEGRITFHNDAAAEFWGRHPEPGADSWCGSWRLYWPDGRPMAHDECPLAVALREGRPIRGAEAIAERPDGTRIPFLAHPTPLFDEMGRITGVINTLIDLRERRQGEEIARHFAAIVESSFDAMISVDLHGTIESWNRGATRLFGYAPEEVIGRPLSTLFPPDRQDDERNILGRVRRGERVEHYEATRMRKDGTRIEVSLSASPIRDASGRVVGMSKIAHDITERKRAEEQQLLLLREMNHRVKNVFALASGIVTLSAREAATPTNLVAEVRDRLGALARAHELTLPDLGSGTPVAASTPTTIGALVETILSPHTDAGDAARIVISGPEVRISGSAVTSFALLLHEFATNAAKHGALAEGAGRLTVEWRVTEDKLLLVWAESGSPLRNGERREGFGSVLSRGAVERQLGGELSRDWREDGLTIRLSVPVANLGG